MAASKVKTRCSRCEEIQRLYIAGLEDKRTILVRLQREQGRVRKLSKEIEALERQNRQAEERSRLRETTNSMESNEVHRTTLKGTELEKRLNEAMTVNRQWKEEYEQLKEKHNTDLRKLQEEVNSLNHKLEESDTHILALESENLRLAQTLSGDNIIENTNENGPGNDELVKFQIQAYKEDFSCERRDRERAQGEKESLQEELKSAQEIISTLMEEIEIYKLQHNQDQEQMRQVLRQPNLTQPQLQIIYPILDPSERQQRTQWRRQQQRRGILSRGAHIAPPSVFYGGDVEVDQEDGPRSEPITDGYRTV